MINCVFLFVVLEACLELIFPVGSETESCVWNPYRYREILSVFVSFYELVRPLITVRLKVWKSWSEEG